MSAAPLKLFLLGSTGRMGLAIQEVLKDSKLNPGLVLAGQSSGRNLAELAAIENLPMGSVVVNFSSAAVGLAASKHCAKSGARLLECSTGYQDSEIAAIAAHFPNGTWAMTPNTSLGVFAFMEAAKVLATYLPADFQMKIWESHHTQKKDAPSGTAKLLKREVENASHAGRITNVESVREGQEVGHHKLIIEGPFEDLMLEHHAQDRKLFAIGALLLAKRLAQSPARKDVYSAAELWKLKQS